MLYGGSNIDIPIRAHYQFVSRQRCYQGEDGSSWHVTDTVPGVLGRVVLVDSIRGFELIVPSTDC